MSIHSPSDLALIYYYELHPSAFFLAFHLVMLIMVALHAGSFCSPFLFSLVQIPLILHCVHCSLIDQAAHLITAQEQLRPMLARRIHDKPAVYHRVVFNSFCPLAGESVFIPKIDQQAEKQPCASDWNADKELCLARHRELHDYADVARPTSSGQQY
jgi:hypothetical protein